MSTPRLTIKLTGSPAIQFDYGDRIVRVAPLRPTVQVKFLLNLALRDEAFEGSVMRDVIVKSHNGLDDAAYMKLEDRGSLTKFRAALDNQIMRLREWLLESSDSAQADMTSYIQAPEFQKDGIKRSNQKAGLKFSNLCDTDLRQFRRALKTAQETRSIASILELRRKTDTIEKILLAPFNQVEEWIPDAILLQQHRNAFAFEMDAARELLETRFHLGVPSKRFYVGRGELSKIEAEFSKPDAERSTIVAITGESGVGKTGAAIEYAHLNKDRYGIRLWLDARDARILQAQYIHLAEWLGLASTEIQSSIRAVKHWLEHTGNYLLVFDHLTYPLLLDNYLPSCPGGHILVTTRLNSLGPRSAANIPLDCFPPEEGLHFLERRCRTGGLVDSAQMRSVLKAIAEKLGGLPLALELAAAAIIANYRNFPNRYLHALIKKRDDIAAENISLTDAEGDYIDPRLYAAFMISFSALTDAERDLLRFLAVMGSAPFQAEWLEKSGDTVRTTLLKHAVNLDFFSLCNCSGEAFLLNGTVQAMVWKSLTADERAVCIRRAVTALNAILPAFRFEFWPLYKDLLPHLLAVCLVPNDMLWDDERMANLLHRTGRYLTAGAMMEDALTCHTRCLEILGKLHPEGSESGVAALIGMADHYVTDEQRDIAHEYIAAAYEMAKDHLPKVSRWWGDIYEKMAWRLSNGNDTENDLKEGERMARLGLECASGLTVPLLWSTLGILLEKQERYKEAHAAFQQVLDAHASLRTENREREGFCYANMGTLSAHIGEFDRSRQEAQKALDIFARLYNKQHHDYATALIYFAFGREVEGSWLEAANAAEKAYEIRKNWFGEANSATCEALSLLISARIYLNMLDEAARLLNAFDEMAARSNVVLEKKLHDHMDGLRILLAERIAARATHR